MNVHVQLFARARDLAGAGAVTVEIDDVPTVGGLRQALVRSQPGLQAIAGSLHIAVNGDYADDALLIPADAEVACFPPVSGG